MPPPLAHLRVVDLTDLRGALAGRLLADLGADVVKVEPPGGDPDRLRPAFAASGALHASGFRELPPCWLPGHVAHDSAAIFGVIGALAALVGRTRDGEGETVEVSVQEAALNGLNPWSIPLADYARLYPMVNASPPRNADGAEHVLPTADGYVRVLPGTPRHWQAFLTLLRNPEALAGPEWEVALFRLVNGDVIRLLAADALADRKRADVLAEGRALGLPIAPVNRLDEFVAEAQTRERGYFRATRFPHLADGPF